MTTRARARSRSVAVLATVAVAVLAITTLTLVSRGRPSPSSAGTALRPTALPVGSPGSTLPSNAPASPSPGPSPDSISVPLVPVVGFREPWSGTDAKEVASVLAGKSHRYAAIELVALDVEPALEALGTTKPDNATRLLTARDAATLRRDLGRHPNRLGFLRLAEVDPSVRALAWSGVRLFGPDRATALSAWPLTYRPRAGGAGDPALATAYDPSTAWSLAAVGDIMLDRLVAYTIKNEGKGVDFPFDGGTAVITGHTCCNPLGHPSAIAHRTGHAGAMRALLSGADLALANFENPAPNNFEYHATGFTFSADPKLIEGVRNAGIDWVSLANNHIRNYGGQGILDTIANLDHWGVAHGGAGANAAQARKASLFDVGGITVGILAYDTIRPDFAARAGHAGTNEMSVRGVRVDIAAARAAGADLVIVFPHWGIEYTAQTTARQRVLARAAIDAGADLVLGSHPHWAGGIEVYKGKPIFYCLGDFVFNIDASEQTLEGIVPVLTFQGTRLVQVDVKPYLILDLSQPNLLDPAGSGKVVLDQVWKASTALPW